MNILWKQLSLVTVLFLLFISNAFAQEKGATYIERDLYYLSAVWPGDYDNQEQVSIDARAYDLDEAELPRFHALVARLTMPSLGDYVFYVEKRRNDDPNRIHSRHVYNASAEIDNKTIRLSAYRVKSKSSKKDISTLRKRQLERLTGCDILLRRDGYDLVGQTESTGCFEPDNKNTYIERFMRISADQYSFNDRRVGANGEYVSNFMPRNMLRARWFACMVDVPKDTLGKADHTQHYTKLHDQGGQFAFTHPDGRELILAMRNLWSFGMQRKTFFIGVFEDTITSRPLVYSWAQPGSDRIGINPGYLRIQCDLDTPENVELQKGIRLETSYLRNR